MDVPGLNVNVDVRKRLHLTPAAEALVREQAEAAGASARLLA